MPAGEQSFAVCAGTSDHGSLEKFDFVLKIQDLDMHFVVGMVFRARSLRRDAVAALSSSKVASKRGVLLFDRTWLTIEQLHLELVESLFRHR